jgi:hypothetical protein
MTVLETVRVVFMATGLKQINFTYTIKK